ncbi:MAG: hypothetical protein ABSH28_24640 [Acidobacteriota bacterium]|jgi:hypothetical protein
MKRQFLAFAVTLMLALTFGVVLARPTAVHPDGSVTGQIVRLARKAVKCPICGSGAYFTGTTKVDVSGKLLRLYRCLRFEEHEFWVAAD